MDFRSRVNFTKQRDLAWIQRQNPFFVLSRARSVRNSSFSLRIDIIRWWNPDQWNTVVVDVVVVVCCSLHGEHSHPFAQLWRSEREREGDRVLSTSANSQLNNCKCEFDFCCRCIWFIFLASKRKHICQHGRTCAFHFLPRSTIATAPSIVLLNFQIYSHQNRTLITCVGSLSLSSLLFLFRFAKNLLFHRWLPFRVIDIDLWDILRRSNRRISHFKRCFFCLSLSFVHFVLKRNVNKTRQRLAHNQFMVQDAWHYKRLYSSSKLCRFTCTRSRMEWTSKRIN